MRKFKIKNNRYVISSRKKHGHRFINRIGEIYDTKYGKCKIIKYLNRNDVTVVFINTGYETHTKMDHVIRDCVRDRSIKVTRPVEIKRPDEVGKIYHTSYGDCKIVEFVNNCKVVIEFTETNNKTTASFINVASGKVKDYMRPNVYGVGYLGNRYKQINKEYKMLHKVINKTWRSMIERCYRSEADNYYLYGGTGVRVDNRWFNYSNFFYDFIKLPGYDESKYLNKKLALDKDKLQWNIPKSQRVYSKDTCCLLSPAENSEFRSRTRHFIAIHPDKTETLEFNMAKFAKDHNLDDGTISGCIDGKYKAHRGYRFKPYIEKCND